MSFDPAQGFRLGPFIIEPPTGDVVGADGESHHLEPKVMDVFVCLARHANELVTRDQIFNAIWRGQDVSDEPITRAIGELRRALKDSRANPSYIETIPKRGYRLIGELRGLEDPESITANSLSGPLPDRRAQKWHYIFVMAVIAVIAWPANSFLTLDQPGEDQSPLTDGNSEPDFSIAVLPFANMPSDPVQIGVSSANKRPTENPDAYALYLRATAASNIFDFQTSAVLFRQAIELDPDFAEAYEALANSYSYPQLVSRAPAEAQMLVLDAARRALVLDPDLAFAHEPENSAAAGKLWVALNTAGYMNEAAQLATELVDRDPLSMSANLFLYTSLIATERLDEGRAILSVIEQLHPQVANWNRGLMNIWNQNYDLAIENMQATFMQWAIPSRDRDRLANLINEGRDAATGQSHLDREIPLIIATAPSEIQPEFEGEMTLFYLYFGFVDAYFDQIAAFEPSERRWSTADKLMFLGTISRHFGFTAHPRYLELAETLGIVDVWEQRGPPDFCRKRDEVWVCE